MGEVEVREEQGEEVVPDTWANWFEIVTEAATCGWVACMSLVYAGMRRAEAERKAQKTAAKARNGYFCIFIFYIVMQSACELEKSLGIV
jgi:hypothetical protein